MCVLISYAPPGFTVTVANRLPPAPCVGMAMDSDHDACTGPCASMTYRHVPGSGSAMLTVRTPVVGGVSGGKPTDGSYTGVHGVVGTSLPGGTRLRRRQEAAGSQTSVALRELVPAATSKEACVVMVCAGTKPDSCPVAFS